MEPLTQADVQPPHLILRRKGGGGGGGVEPLSRAGVLPARLTLLGGAGLYQAPGVQFAGL